MSDEEFDYIQVSSIHRPRNMIDIPESMELARALSLSSTLPTNLRDRREKYFNTVQAALMRILDTEDLSTGSFFTCRPRFWGLSSQ